MNGHSDGLLGFKAAFNTGNIICFLPRKIKGGARKAVHKLQGQNPHPNQVGTVYPLKAFGDNGLNAKQARSLRRPVPG